MLKKISLALACSLLVGHAYAAPMSCGYKDYIHFSDDTPAGAYISYANSDSDLYLEVLSARSFVIRDTIECQSGYADVYVNLDQFNACALHIKDGPYMRHPSVQATCVGDLKYVGIKYDGIGTRSYTMTFH